jgi:SecD/SecF fusion protein
MNRENELQAVNFSLFSRPYHSIGIPIAMKNKGTVLVISAILAVACIYQLSFSWVVNRFETKAKRAATKNGVYNPRDYNNYVDSVGRTTIFNLGFVKFNYFECKQREINLGLDLRGGMNVILEVQKSEIIRGLANNREDADLLNALKAADARQKSQGGDFIDLFATEYARISKGRKMANLFANTDNRQFITFSSSDAEVVNYIRREANSAVDRVYSVIEKRINQSNVTQPTIQQLDGGRISVELPGVDNPKRMEDLLEKSASLEFWETYDNSEKNQFQAWKYLKAAYEASSEMALKMGGSDSAKTDSVRVKTDSTAVAAAATPADSTVDKSKKDSIAAAKKTEADKASDNKIVNSPLFKLLQPNMTQQGQILPGARLAFATRENHKKVIDILESPAVKRALPFDVKFAWDAKPVEEGSNYYGLYFLKLNKFGKPAIAGDQNMISDAFASTSQTGEIEINMRMYPAVANEWAQVTGDNIGRCVAIVLDDKVYSAPTVQAKITGGQSNITGDFDVKEADDLANVLKAGKLPAPATIVASDVVGPSLGKQAIQSGMLSLIMGTIAVILFMILYYNRAGFIAIVAVFANIFLILGILSSYGAALTLPGLAGIVLTIGMAVDANVLIYERVKDELRAGKSLRAAVQGGFGGALSAIVDANITTLLAGVVLMFVGAGPVYGFAIILVIGIFSSMFTALLVSRLLIERRLDKNKDLKFSFPYSENTLKGFNIDFVKNRKYYYIFSLSFILAGAAAFAIKGGLTTGLDFKGGWAFQIQTDPAKNYDVSTIKKALDDNLKGSSNEVKTIGSAGQFKIVTSHMLDLTAPNSRDSVTSAVLNALSGINLTKTANGEGPVLGTSKVGPALAAETRNKSFVMLIIAVVGIFLYIVFRFRYFNYGVGAIIALIHDVLAVLAFFALFDGVFPFPMEFDQNLVAALLTLVGYSINDTVVVFDRIREFLAENKSVKDEKTVINMAINQTLSRTIVTSLTVLAVVLILFIFGGDILKGFSLAMLVGVVFGSYSTICIATPIVIDLGFKRKKK